MVKYYYTAWLHRHNEINFPRNIFPLPPTEDENNKLKVLHSRNKNNNNEFCLEKPSLF